MIVLGNLVLAWACTVTVHVGVAPSPYVEQVTRDAVAQLDAASPVHFVMVERPGADVEIVWDPAVHRNEAFTEIDGTETAFTAATVHLPMRSNRAVTGWIALHELGHVGNLDHNPDPASAMSPHPVGPVRFGVVDLVALRWAGRACIDDRH